MRAMLQKKIHKLATGNLFNRIAIILWKELDFFPLWKMYIFFILTSIKIMYIFKINQCELILDNSMFYRFFRHLFFFRYHSKVETLVWIRDVYIYIWIQWIKCISARDRYWNYCELTGSTCGEDVNILKKS